MNDSVHYFCCSHIGKRRSINQDNFICERNYMSEGGPAFQFPLEGRITLDRPSLLGVFDGMGGEECGEVASLLAAKSASETAIGENPLRELLNFCRDANEKICEYAAEHDISAMGTTAAVIAFSGSGIAFCNLGDSKIFRFSRRGLKQLSVDHYGVAAYGRKPPLSQYLGIPPSEMMLIPHVAGGPCSHGDIYLLCSDGLTDMVPVESIAKVLAETEFDKAIDRLLCAALDRGGMDNITIILCKIERKKRNLFSKLLRKIGKQEEENRNGK